MTGGANDPSDARPERTVLFNDTDARTAFYRCSGCDRQFRPTDGAQGDDSEWFCHGCWAGEPDWGGREPLFSALESESDATREEQLHRALGRVSERWKLSLSPQPPPPPPPLPGGDTLVEIDLYPTPGSTTRPSADSGETVAAPEHAAVGVDSAGRQVTAETFYDALEEEEGSQGLDDSVGSLLEGGKGDTSASAPAAAGSRAQRDAAVHESGGFPQPRVLFSDELVNAPHPPASPFSLYGAASQRDFATVEHLARSLLAMTRNEDAEGIKDFAISVSSGIPCQTKSDPRVGPGPAPADSEEVPCGGKSPERRDLGAAVAAGQSGDVGGDVAARQVTFAPHVASVAVASNGQLEVELVPSNLLSAAPPPGLESGAAAEAGHDALR